MSGFLASTAADCDTLNKSTPLHFVVQPSRNLICLLCQQVFDDPVISECGHTFCRRCISSNQSSRCPIHCERPLTAVVDNLAVHEQIDELFIKCKYGSTYSNDLHSWVTSDDGCPAVIKVSEKLNHENVCEFRLVQCPNCLDGPKIRFKDLQTHLRGCQRLKCNHQQYGCPFVGNEDQLHNHLLTECKLEPFKEFLRLTEDRFQEQTELLQLKDREIGFLRSVITKLSERVDDMDLKLESLQECSARTDLDLIDLRRDVEELAEDFQLSKSNQPPVQQVHEFKCIGTFVGHEGPVWCLAGHRDYVYSGSSDATIKVWDVVNSFECIKTLEGHEGIVLSLCIFDNKLYSGSSDCCFNVWSLETYSLLRRVQAHDQAVCTMASWTSKLITGSLKSIKIWDVNNSCNLLKELSGLNHWVRALFVSQNLLYSGSHQSVMVFDLNVYQCLKTIETNGGNVYGLYLYENLLFCAVSENVIHVINVSSDKVINTLKGHEGTVYCVTVLENFNNGSAVLLSSSYDKSIRIWNLKTNLCIHTFVRHQGSVSSLLVHNDRVYSGAVDSCIKVWC